MCDGPVSAVRPTLVEAISDAARRYYSERPGETVVREAAPKARRLPISAELLAILASLRSASYVSWQQTRLTALCPGLPGWAGTRKVKPIWTLLKQKTVSGSGISWAICESTPRSRQITTPAPHHSVFYRPDALPAAQPTASKHWRQKGRKQLVKFLKIYGRIAMHPHKMSLSLGALTPPLNTYGSASQCPPPAKNAPFLGAVGPHLIHMVPCPNPRPHPKRPFDRFSRFRMAHVHAKRRKN